MNHQPLWQRLFLAYLWVPIVVLVLIGLYGSETVRSLFQEQLKSDLEARARLAADPITPLLERNDCAKIDALCKKLGHATDMRITVVLASGKVVGDSHENPRELDNHKNRAEIQEAWQDGVGSAIRFSSTESQDRIYVAVLITVTGESKAIVRTSLPLTQLTRSLATVRNRLIVAGVLGILVQAIISLAISRWLSRPMEHIRDGAERFAAGDLHHRLPLEGSSEVAAVSDALNRMAAELDERIQTVLRQQNEREAMLSSMEEGVLAIDNEGRILSLNTTCAGLLGGESDRLQGHTVYEVIRKADLLQFVEEALASPTALDGEIALRGGEQNRWVNAHSTTLHDPQRNKIGVLIVLHDVTRVRHLEEIRRDFVANVSHELRTPITSIKGFIETLMDGALDDRDHAEHFLQIMHRQVNRLDAIITDLLVLSRIERSSEEQLVERSQEPIFAVLQAAVEMCNRRATEKGIEIEVMCPADLSGNINAPLLEQAVINLLDNAIKYSGPGSTTTIEARCESNELVLRVTDQGCGIEARHLPRLFERFYRVDKARSRELGGTGLGLAIVRHITLAHRGTVSVESTVGVGSVFTIRLPAE
jgi:two-component system phosphate regulon sensor histidine kinase PhoR